MVKMIVFLFHLEHLFRETKRIIHTDMYFSLYCYECSHLFRGDYVVITVISCDLLLYIYKSKTVANIMPFLLIECCLTCIPGVLTADPWQLGAE